MACRTHKLDSLPSYKYVVIISVYKGALVLSKHNLRESWETQGGHIEKGETPLEAAKRELYEESGAVEFDIRPIFDYRSGNDTDYADGQVFFAKITRFEPIPEGSEMRDVGFFDRLPTCLTYPDITPVLIEESNKMKITDFKIEK